MAKTTIFGEKIGPIFENEKVKVAHKVFKKGSEVPRHNHEGKLVFFTPVKGKLEITVEDETQVIEPGQVLHYDGEYFMHVLALEDSEAFIYFVSK